MDFYTTVGLQQTLAAGSMAADPGPIDGPHHPVTCLGPLRYEDDGTFRCEHAKVGPDDRRTLSALDHSIAILLIETAVHAFCEVPVPAAPGVAEVQATGPPPPPTLRRWGSRGRSGT